jgi:hypothetical protein
MLLLPCSMVVAAELSGVARACISDVKTQCAGVNPGEGRIRECILPDGGAQGRESQRVCNGREARLCGQIWRGPHGLHENALGRC